MLLNGRLHRPRRALRPVIGRVGAGDSCGCAMGARFLIAGLITSVLWYVLHGRVLGLSMGGIILRILLWSFLAACVGKIVGIIRFSLRSRHYDSK
jgi:hypothetical protein